MKLCQPCFTALFESQIGHLELCQYGSTLNLTWKYTKTDLMFLHRGRFYKAK